VAEALVRLRQKSGTLIHLDIEPEPDCSIENTDETIAFFEKWLTLHGAPWLMAQLGCSLAAAHAAILEHVRVCFDCCHFAVEYEDPLQAIDRLRHHGIRIGRVQLSSAIRVNVPADVAGRAAVVGRLRPFADPVYLHQVVEQRGTAALTHYPDLPQALAAGHAGHASEWRIHFHVPLFTADYGGLGSTQPYVRQVIEAARAGGFTHHLEIETYTWDVLPGDLKIDLLESIGREYDWVLKALGRA
jgi:hypothetical protein